METVETIFGEALTDLGVKAPGESLTTADDATALLKVQFLVRSWNSEGLTIPCYTWDSFTLTASQAKYEFGTGGDYTTFQPNRIVDAFIRDSGDSDHPVEIIGPDQYAAISSKSTTGRPQYLWYTKHISATSTALANGYLYPTPSSAEDLHFFAERPYAVPSAKTDNLYIHDEYYLAFIKELAIECAPAFGYAVPPDYQMRAFQLKQAVKSKNASLNVTPANINVTAGRSRYSILEG